MHWMKWMLLMLSANNDPAPDNSTEIVCFAANNKWVCAPENERENALRKAESINQQAESDPASETDIEINTLPNQPRFNEVEETPQPVQQPAQRIARPEASRAESTEPSETTRQPIRSTPAPATQQTPVRSERDSGVTETTMHLQSFEDWQQTHRNHWSLQVVGVGNRQNLPAFIRQHGLDDGPIAVVRTEVNGNPWWVVLYGLYPDRDAALEGKENLPRRLISGAWVRQINAIQGRGDDLNPKN